MILREMPPIWDEKFRPGFYARWGRENCIVSACTRHAEYPLFQQRLSIKAAWGGREDYFVDGRRVAVDDDTFIIFNDGRSYSSRLRSVTPVVSFAIFFRPGIASEVARTLSESHERLLDDPDTRAQDAEFSEHLRRHDRAVSPVLRFIHNHAQAGITDEQWYEEQLYFLLHRMLLLRNGDLCATNRIPAARPATRRELFRRIGLAADYINTHFFEPIGLAHIAAAGMLSPYHCLRVFKAVYGVTPATFLSEKRVQAAHRLLRTSDINVDEVAALVGFQSRTSLFRHMRRALGAAPSVLRRQGRHDKAGDGERRRDKSGAGDRPCDG